MRVASIGHVFADTRIHSIGFRDSDTILEFDAVIWWPEEVLPSYAKGATAYRGRTSLREFESFRIEEDRSRRLNEFREFLALGKPLLLFVPSPNYWFVDTGQKEYSGTGKNRQTTRIVDEMSLASFLPIELELVAASGEEIVAATTGFVSQLWAQLKDLMFYQAYVATPLDTSELFIRGTSYVVGGSVRAGDGIILLLPLLNVGDAEWSYRDEDGSEIEEPRLIVDPDEERAVDALLGLVAQLVRTPATLPEWASAYVLPEETEGLATLGELTRQSIEITERIAHVEAALTRLTERKHLFTASGATLEDAVHQSLQALGFEVEEGPQGRTDRIIRRGDQEAVVEIKGVEKGAGEKHAAQLQKWASAFHAETGREPKGILVVNAWRSQPLESRVESAFPDQMIEYATRQNQALVTGLQLLCAWIEAETSTGKTDEIVASLLSAKGRWDRYEHWEEFVTPSDTRAADEPPGNPASESAPSE